ncbi:MAG: outer membrane lipid asymmetry maintenance protein MlaD, partial [Actinomycetota bacterium]
MGRNLIETIMGAVVLAVAAFFLVFAYSHASVKKIEGYEVVAAFNGVGGLETGADVKINGIKVGTVTSQALDPQTFNAVIKLAITPSVQLPSDTVASISSEGLLGGKFVKLEPGKSKQTVPAGGTLAKTKDFRSIEEMVGELIFLATADNAAPEAAPATPEAAPAVPPAQPEAAPAAKP